MLILTRSETKGLVRLAEVIDAVERAFELDGRGLTLDARRFHVLAPNDGTFHVVTGGVSLTGERTLLSLKVSGHFPQPQRPAHVTGAVLVIDAEDGTPVALLDGRFVTTLRTAAVTAVAAKHLARADARSALIIGAGRQAPWQIEALATVLSLESIAVSARRPSQVEVLVKHAQMLGIEAQVALDPRAAARSSDVIVTVTSAREPLLFDADVPPGCLVAALGADSPEKGELDPFLLANSRVVVDRLAQAANAGELRAALAAGAVVGTDVYAELGEIVAGVKPGRTHEDERFVFDSTGTALQDVAAASLIITAAREQGRGIEIDLVA